MILLYCPEESPRITWVLDLILSQLLGLDYWITSRPDELNSFEGPKISYSDAPMGDIPWIPASGLLFENGISDQSHRLNPGTWKSLKTLFHTPGASPSSPPHISTSSHLHISTFPFDLLSAVFYLVSRYEEYLPFKPDEHGRFPSTESLASKMEILEEPIVNQWAQVFGDELENHFGRQIGIKKPAYRFISTIDVDNAWAYAHKGWKRTIGGFWNDRKSMVARNFRFQVLRENQPDPYDTYDLIERFHREAGTEPLWFFLLGHYGKYDKNISPRNCNYQRLIRGISRDGRVGIHPSYHSHASPDGVAREVSMLSHILGQPVIRSRQHFLKLRLPATYRALIRAGIREDYSLGYADKPGFRAGIALPFRFFDLERNKAEDLTVYPFQVMDQTLRQYLDLKPDEALARVLDLADKTKKAGGTLITLWHNESLSEWNEWTGWSEVYRQILKQAATPRLA